MTDNSFEPTMNDADRVDFASKDNLPPSSDLKRVMGSEFHDEFTKIINDFKAVKEEFVTVHDSVGAASEVFASLTYGGGASGNDNNNYMSSPDEKFCHNIKSVSWPKQDEAGEVNDQNWRFCRVEFTNKLPGATSEDEIAANPPNGAINQAVNIQVTPFSADNNSIGVAGFVNAVVTNIDESGCEIAFTQRKKVGEDFVDWVVWFQAFCLLVARN